MSNAMVWVHCNQCFELFIHKRKQIHLLSCLHILCESCLQTVSSNRDRTCPFCKKHVASKLICPEMGSRYWRYFSPTPWKNPSNFHDVVPFQLKHRKHLHSAMIKAEREAEKIQNEMKLLKKKFMALYKQRSVVKKARTMLELKIKEYRNKAYM